jgi:hypothetical protein
VFFNLEDSPLTKQEAIAALYCARNGERPEGNKKPGAAGRPVRERALNPATSFIYITHSHFFVNPPEYSLLNIRQQLSVLPQTGRTHAALIRIMRVAANFSAARSFNAPYAQLCGFTSYPRRQVNSNTRRPLHSTSCNFVVLIVRFSD